MEEMEKTTGTAVESAAPAGGITEKLPDGMVEELAAEAAKELLIWPADCARKKIGRALRKLAGRKLAPIDRYSWPNGLLALGLYRYREAEAGVFRTASASIDGRPADRTGGVGGMPISPVRTGTQERCRQALTAYFDGWAAKGWPVRSLEDSLSGYVLLLLYEEEYGKLAEPTKQYARPDQAGRAGSWREGIRRVAEFLRTYPRTETGSLPYRADQENGYVYVDALGMAVPFLVKYGLLSEEPEMLEAGLRQFTAFFSFGMEESLGLPYHGYEGSGAVRYGLPGWGRGTGWMLLGLAEALTALKQAGRAGREPGESGQGEREPGEFSLREREPVESGKNGLEKQTAALEEAFICLADVVRGYVRPDGTLSWLIPAKEGPADSSALSMCLYGIALGVREGLLQADRYEKVLRAGSAALARQGKGGKVYGASGECGGFGVYPQIYGAFPWSLGPALGFLTQL